jgi:predicted dehydrogenase
VHRAPSRGRRRFLKSLGGAALLAGPRLASAQALGANERIPIGVIGTGGRARGLMRHLKSLPAAKLAAACDVYEPRLREALEIAGTGCASHSDYRRVLDDKQIPAVVIGAPDHWHKQMTLDALAAGKDVYLEKPISRSIEEGEALVKAAEASRQVVQTGMQQRSWEHWVLGKSIVDSGKLGKVTFVHSYWYQRFGTGPLPEIDFGKLDWNAWLGPAPARDFDAERFTRWRHFKDYAGGMLTDLLTHWIDMVQWYLGVDAPLSAQTTGANYIFKTWDWPDTATAVLEYPKAFQATHTGTYASGIDDGGLEIRGDRATLKIDRERLAVYSEESRRQPGARYLPEPEILVRSLADGTIAHLANWLDCIKSRKTPNAGMRAGHEAARAAQIANQSLLLGAKVRFDETSGKVAKL